MAGTTAALDYLSKPSKHPAGPVTVVFGDEPFLKRLAIEQIRGEVLSGDEGEFSLTRFDGKTCQARDVFDELATVALFGGGRRLVMVDDADDFVTANRGALEDYVARPKATGVLLLEVKSWAKTTRLYKSVEKSGLQIDCKQPTEAKLLKWLVSWAGKRHQTRLEPAAAEAMLELVGAQMGLLDQELAKLAVSVPAGESVSPTLVQELVGGWRTKTTWDMLDTAVEGNASAALKQLDRLLLAGEHPVAILGQISATLRRFAAATRLIEQAEMAGGRINLRQALEEAGFRTFVLSKAERQLKQVGRQRGRTLYRRLLELDLDLKGNSSKAPRDRFALERLVVRLSKTAAPTK